MAQALAWQLTGLNMRTSEEERTLIHKLPRIVRVDVKGMEWNAHTVLKNGKQA